jgi:hypothetical protein
MKLLEKLKLFWIGSDDELVYLLNEVLSIDTRSKTIFKTHLNEYKTSDGLVFDTLQKAITSLNTLPFLSEEELINNHRKKILDEIFK